MNIDITNVVTLSDDIQYVVVSKAELEGKKYYYFVDINDNKNIKFLVEDGSDLVELNPADKELFEKIIPIFIENVKEVIPEEVLNEMKDLVTPEMLEQITQQQDTQAGE